MVTQDVAKMERDLIDDGYCVASDILDSSMLVRLRLAARDALATRELDEKSNFGSLIKCEYESPVYAELIA